MTFEIWNIKYKASDFASFHNLMCTSILHSSLKIENAEMMCNPASRICQQSMKSFIDLNQGKLFVMGIP